MKFALLPILLAAAFTSASAIPTDSDTTTMTIGGGIPIDPADIPAYIKRGEYDSESSKAELEKRSNRGVYLCAQPNFRGGCQYFTRGNNVCGKLIPIHNIHSILQLPALYSVESHLVIQRVVSNKQHQS